MGGYDELLLKIYKKIKAFLNRYDARGFQQVTPEDFRFDSDCDGGFLFVINKEGQFNTGMERLEELRSDDKEIIATIPINSDSELFHEISSKCNAICFIRELPFNLFYFGQRVDEFIVKFSHYGLCVQTKKSIIMERFGKSIYLERHFNHRLRAKQLIDFTGFQNGDKSLTDIDGFEPIIRPVIGSEDQNYGAAYFFYEAKYKLSKSNIGGQISHLNYIVRDLDCKRSDGIRKPACLIFFEHEQTDPEDDIMMALGKVNQILYRGFKNCKTQDYKQESNWRIYKKNHPIVKEARKMMVDIINSDVPGLNIS